MAKKKLLSAKARLILKVVTGLWIVLVVMLIAKLGTGETTRTVPSYTAVTKNFVLPDTMDKAQYRAYRKGFVGTGYKTAEEIVVGGKTIAKSTELGEVEFDLLIEARHAKPLALLDPVELRKLADLETKAVRDIRSKSDVKDFKDILLVEKGGEIDLEHVKALVEHGWAGEKIAVKGEDQIVGINLTLVFVAINFLFLVAILYGILWEPVLKILDERAEKIRADLETAETERTDASELKGQYTDQLAKINQERVALIDRGRQEGYEERERIVGEARAEAEKVVASGKAEIEAATEKARKELMTQISDLSAAMAAEIIRREIRPADHKALIDRFVAKMDDTQLN